MGKRKYPTASQLQRAFSCLYPWRSHVEWLDDAPGYPSRVGSAVHEAIEHHLCSEEVNVQAIADRHGVSALDVQKLYDVWSAWAATQVDLGGDVERAMSADGHLVQEHGLRVGRNYPDEACVPGTADLVEATRVTDWKTSLGIDTTAAPAAENWQLHALAAMANKKRVRLVVITENGVREDEADANHHEDTLGRVLNMQRTIDLDVMPPAPGAHCAYCPAAHACPATSAAQTAIVGTTQPTLDLSTGDGIYHARVYLKLVDAARDRLDEAIKEAVKAAGGRIDLGNGRALKLSTRSRETIQWTDEEKDAARFDGRVKTSMYDVLTEGKA